MKKITKYIIIISIFLYKQSSAQETGSFTPCGELFGPGLFCSASVESLIKQGVKYDSYVRFGVGCVPNLIDQEPKPKIELNANASLLFVRSNNEKWSHEFGIGVGKGNIIGEKYIALNTRLGLRRNFESVYLSLSINQILFVGSDFQFIQPIFPGIGIGKRIF
ncbi:MAG: hypothetical protein HYZ42_14625 [Bacteroidetes bacterium]|nr:hypothetical protein [Bacteroidota bacterium]